jgi:hypothetical protein
VLAGTATTAGLLLVRDTTAPSVTAENVTVPVAGLPPPTVAGLNLTEVMVSVAGGDPPLAFAASAAGPKASPPAPKAITPIAAPAIRLILVNCIDNYPLLSRCGLTARTYD